MGDLLEEASYWLAGMNRQFRSRTVLYVRGGTSREVTATVGKSVFEVPGDYGIPQRVESRDYLVPLADLASFGQPKAGDQVRDTINGQMEIYEVMAPANQPHFTVDAYRITYRIHTKHVGTESL